LAIRRPEFVNLRNALLRLSKQKGIVSERILKFVRGGITEGLNPAEFDVFTRKALLENFAEQLRIKPDSKLPWNYTSELVEKDLAAVRWCVAAARAGPCLERLLEREVHRARPALNPAPSTRTCMRPSLAPAGPELAPAIGGSTPDFLVVLVSRRRSCARRQA